jgi:hypothetical protein
MKTIFSIAIGACLVGSVGIAAIPATNGTIKGCYDQKGNLRVVDERASCDLGETLLTWSQTGQGPQGPAGPPGPGTSVKTFDGRDWSQTSSFGGTSSVIFYDLMNIPPGNHAIEGRVDVLHITNAWPYCELRAYEGNGQTFHLVDNFDAEPIGVFSHHTMIGVVQNTSTVPWELILACDGQGLQFGLQHLVVNMTKVDQIMVVAAP